MLNAAMETTEQTVSKVPVAAKLDPALFAVIEQFRIDEDRNLSNMIERLLKTHPRIQEVLDGQESAVSA